MTRDLTRPTAGDLRTLFVLKYGEPESAGWAPRTWHRIGYYTPDEYYEATLARLVAPGCRWADVGCGRDLLPSHRALAGRLAARCGRLVGIDPDDTLDENPFVHERVKVPIEEYEAGEPFDLVTLRMVAEHVADPARVASVLARMTRPGGFVVVYTVSRWAPLSMLAKLVPFAFHHRLKRAFWGTEERDTFPVAYRMNTRRALASLFARAGLAEASFQYLDDCRTFHRFRWLHRLDLLAWQCLRTAGLRHPECCLLGIYRRRDDRTATAEEIAP